MKKYIKENQQGKAAVLGWGRGMGHTGHDALVQAVIHQAQKTNATPFFVVSRSFGKDDPIPPEMKLSMYQKKFPKYAKMFSLPAPDKSTINDVLASIGAKGYTNVTLVVGEDQKAAFGFLTRPDKSGVEPFRQYGLDSLSVMSRQETKAPSSDPTSPQYHEGPRATPMREVLLDPNKSEEEQFAVWRQSMSPSLSDQEVMDMMNTAKENLVQFHTKKPRVKKASQLKEFITRIRPLLKEANAKQRIKIVGLMREAVRQRLDPKCWKGKHKEGTKIKGGVRVNNCVPNESVAESNILEIDYASELDDSSFSQNSLAKSGHVDGQIEGNDVVMVKNDTQTAYMLMIDNNVSAFIGFENKNLKNIKNFTNAPDVIRALVGYLVHKKGMTISISQNEPLTPEGIKWLVRLIKNPRGLVIKDNAGNDVDIDELKQEWLMAKKSGIAGKTGITITENIDFGKKIRINEASRKSNSMLMPFNFYNVKQGVAEAFDQPYRSKTEKSESGSFDVLAKLPDGTNLSIMFNHEGNDEWQVEFYRNNSQEVTGEGDAQRIFATVLNAIQKFITKHKPAHLTFAASKETDPTVYYEPGVPQPNPASRAKLYDRLVQRYAKAWGYRAFRADNGRIVMYELSRMSQGQQGVAEGTESLDYQGNCTDDDVVDEIFGDVNNFAATVEEYGDEFTLGKLIVKYDPETDVHSFYYKNESVAEGTADAALKEYTVRNTKKFIQRAHDTEQGQKYGSLPYSSHPKSVANIGKKFFGTKFTPDAVKVALLHDVLEDTPYTPQQLAKKGFSKEVIDAVQLLTKNKNLSYSDNIKNIINSGNKLAMMVKYSDNYMNFTGDKSHWDPDRAAQSQKKYLASLNALGDVLGITKHIGDTKVTENADYLEEK